MIVLKDYRQWMRRKAFVHNRQLYRHVNEGDGVWTAVGENVGVEIDGKSKKYSRPVVVLRQYSAKCFTGVPLTTKNHHVGDWYVHFEFQGRQEVAVLIQAKLFDASRVYSRIGKLSRNDYQRILSRFIGLFEKNVP